MRIFLTGRTLEGTHADKVRTCKVHTERQMERNPRPSCCDEVALTLTQRAVAHSRLLPLQNNKGKGERNTVPSKRIPAGSLMSRSYEEMPQTSAHQPMVCHVLHLLNCKLSRSPGSLAQRCVHVDVIWAVCVRERGRFYIVCKGTTEKLHSAAAGVQEYPNSTGALHLSVARGSGHLQALHPCSPSGRPAAPHPGWDVPYQPFSC